MNSVRRFTAILVVAAIVGLAGVSFAESGDAGTYPDKPITIVCTFAAGGLADIITRLYAEGLEEELGVPVQVVNRPGGAMVPGTMSVLDEPSDGYTLIYASTPGLITLPYINNAPYSYDDFVWLYTTGAQKNVLYVPMDSEFETLEDFVEAAKDEKLIVSTNALGAPPTLSMAQFSQSIGIEVEYLSEGTLPAAIVAMIGGHADAAVGQLTQRASYPDEIRALAILDSTGHEVLADVPTAAEALPGMDVVATSWVRGGLGAAADTPQEIIDVLVEASENAFKNAAFEQKFNDSGNLYLWTGYEDMAVLLEEGAAFYYPVIDSLGLRK